MDGARVLLVGQGGREHAIAQALHDSPEHPRIFAAPGNAGMGSIVERVPIAATDVQGITAWARRNEAVLVVVGPEAPLALGLADDLRTVGIPVLGPSREGARLETSKLAAKRLLARLALPTAAFSTAGSADEAERLLADTAYPIVLKADGLASGKGVVIAANKEEARATVDAWMRRRTLGDAGGTLVLEECLRGEEASLLVLTDGERWMLFPPARDHKRVGDGDTGPNTGGMGACAPARVPSSEEAVAIGKAIVDPVLAALREAGAPYRGVLYLGLMLTERGPMVLEFNARFGDPEAQAVLPLLAEDPLALFRAAAEGKLPPERHATFVAHEGAAVCVVLAARGYPQSPETGAVIEGLDATWPHGIRVFHSGTDRRGTRWVVTGGRVLGVTARAETLERAREAAYGAAARIRFDGMHYRRDIAQSPLATGSQTT
ncbi:MAG TPA: phosphoribosylamine--glycine ligase [Candidatus Eisenbacteria bacterium]